MKKWCLFAAILMLALPLQAATLNVNPEGAGAYPTIQSALDAAQPGDEVILDCGVYYQSSISMKSGVTLRSETGYAECAEINGEDLGPIMSGNNLSSETEILGITFKDGYTFEALSASAALFLTNSSPRITRCDFIGNRSEGPEHGWFGTLSCLNESHPVLSECIFHFNRGGVGAAIETFDQASILLLDCTIEETWGISAVSGGSISAFSTRFINNQTIIAIELGAAGVFVDCLIAGNNEGLVGFGSTEITRCTIADNGSGGMRLGAGSTIESSLIANNGDAVSLSAESSINCSNFHGNAGGDWVGDFSWQLGIHGNISLPPQFCGTAGSGNYFIQSDSPCAAPNNECHLLIGAMPVACGTTATEGSTWSRVKSMY